MSGDRATRRRFLAAPAAVAAGGRYAQADWASRPIITVGPAKADIVGTGEKAIQAAVDYAAQQGGGTVQILPGMYRCRNAVFLRSGIRIVGSGADSVLVKEPSRTAKLAEDVDFYEQEIALADPSGFEVGDGVCLRARSLRNGEPVAFTRTLVARNGKRFKLDQPLPGYPAYVDLHLEGGPTATTLFALMHGEGICNAAIEDITLDGNKTNNEFLNGNHVACLFLRSCRHVTLRRVTARDFNGDGISWQTSHDVTAEDCHCHDNESFGMHPGAGSQRPVVRHCTLERNDIGFFFCWGVKSGLVENTRIAGNRRFGVSLGHRDTDNLLRRNEIRLSGETGVLFRDEKNPAFSPNRNRLIENIILDTGADTGVGVDVQGEVAAVVMERNTIRETRQPAQRAGIRIGARSRDITLTANRIDGFAHDILDQRRERK